MASLQINGQQPLAGTVDVNGSKNSALPVLAATLLTSEPCTIEHVPHIEDVKRMLELFESIGVRSEWVGPHTLQVHAERVSPERLHVDVIRTLRASVLLMGALVGRCGGVRIPGPGGDQIGARPLDAHLTAFTALGIDVKNEGGLYQLRQQKRTDVSTVTMSEFSITATENVVLASVLNAGTVTTIECAAADPPVQELCWFLNSLGARIHGIGTHTLRIEGVQQLRGTSAYRIMPDLVEAGTFICLGAAARAELTVVGVPVSFLAAELQKFRETSVRFEIVNARHGPESRYELADVVLRRSTQLNAVRSVHNMPYPGFNPDLLQPFAVLLTQATGTSLVHDWMYEGRLKYVEELNKMGAQIFVSDPHRILVTGPTNLYGADITNYDIRTGASLIIAALIASGTSTIANVYQLDRGYERLDERLQALGAVITRVPS